MEEAGVSERACWVYLIEDMAADAIKIGRSSNPRARLTSLQTGTLNKLNLVYSTRCDPGCEQVIHERFAGLRISGEWFRDDWTIMELPDDAHDYRSHRGMEPEDPLTERDMAFLMATVGRTWTDAEGLALQRKHLGKVYIRDPDTQGAPL